MSTPTDALQRLRRVHEDAVLSALRSAGALSRAQLTERTGLSRTTLFAIISDLMERDAVIETEAVPAEPRGRGRPAALVSLNPAAGLLLGLDLGRGRVRLAVANAAHQVVATASAALREDAAPAEQAEAAVRLVREVAAERGISLGALEAVGLGLVGVLDDHIRTPTPAPTTPALSEPTHAPSSPSESADAAGPPGPHARSGNAGPAGVAGPLGSRAGSGERAGLPEGVPARYLPLALRVAEEFGVRVAVDNNARLAALAEATWGVARPVRDMVYVRWSVGVGGGFLAGGRLLRGAHGAGGEVGHVSLDPGGPPCHCGGRGCLEGRIGGQRLLDACAARGVPLAGLDELVTAAQDRVPAVCEVVASAAADLGRVLAGTVTQLDPALVVVGGELAALGSLVLDPIRDAISRQALPRSPRQIEVTQADLGVNASAMGAIALLLHEEPSIPAHLRPALP
ncbi:ROK family protein [Nonomuraea ferruginea]|uniref:ROK family protein n=1 Tax=Nonomuraea ferruginea TaxID=46174 RepID=A0ABT4TBE2_9ACTN|nr:ROK family protein [Nonomuraea ferruginea]MDA0646812.1 ROK family protein [Nonomuraea ferruginea]